MGAEVDPVFGGGFAVCKILTKSAEETEITNKMVRSLTDVFIVKVKVNFII